MNNTGQYQLCNTNVSNAGGTLYISSNYGNTWSSVTSPSSVYSSAISANGQYITAVSKSNGIWTSNTPDSSLVTGINNPVTPASGTLYINGDVRISGNGYATSFNNTSDYRIKTQVKTLESNYTVDKINPVSYYNNLSNKREIGLIAHELEEIYPELVEGIKDDENNFQSVNYLGLIPILINEIKEIKKLLKKC